MKVASAMPSTRDTLHLAAPFEAVHVRGREKERERRVTRLVNRVCMSPHACINRAHRGFLRSDLSFAHVKYLSLSAECTDHPWESLQRILQHDVKAESVTNAADVSACRAAWKKKTILLKYLKI